MQCFKKHSPKSIAVEKIFTNKNPESTLKLGKARAIIFLVAARFKIDIFEYSPNTVKKKHCRLWSCSKKSGYRYG